QETLENLKALQSLFPELQIQVCQNPTQVDSRSENINIGFEKARGRYLGILDDDDAVFPEHYAVLVNALEKTENAWAYAQTVIHYLDQGYLKARDIRYGSSEYSYPKLWVDNFIPIHCFLLDRCRIQVPGLLRFNDSIQRIEDYEFLLRLGAHYNPAHWNQITSLYNIALDGSNSNYNLVAASDVIVSQESDAKILLNHQAWEKARFVVQGLKRKLWFQHAAKLKD
ncbi:MAG: glycosyltransferase, partial [Cyanobacteria bacterium]|nr:glycosyltransferase [Cyanobacteriota bacterium]